MNTEKAKQKEMVAFWGRANAQTAPAVSMTPDGMLVWTGLISVQTNGYVPVGAKTSIEKCWVAKDRLTQLRAVGVRSKCASDIWRLLCRYADDRSSWSKLLQDKEKSSRAREQAREREQASKRNYERLPKTLQDFLIGVHDIDISGDYFHVSVLCRTDFNSVPGASEAKLAAIKQSERDFCQWLRREVVLHRTYRTSIRTLNPYRILRYTVRKNNEIVVTFGPKNSTK